MASEYYKWLARDVKPEEQKQLTKEEKRRNWWAYHKWHVIIAAACALLVGDLLFDMVQSRRNTPDYCIAYVGQTALSEDAVAVIEEAFAGLGRDITGNGKVQVRLQQYPVAESEPTGDVVTERDVSSAYAGTVRLIADLESSGSTIFLLEDPEAFQASFGVLARVDGTLPEDTPDSAVPIALAWDDCPALAEFGQMEGIHIARRGFWKGESGPEIDGALALFERLTEGAR